MFSCDIHHMILHLRDSISYYFFEEGSCSWLKSIIIVEESLELMEWTLWLDVVWVE